ncbi:MAG: helix-turn-helix transcriptional regulator [Hyphomicrobiales bacterium]|nr:helix-turn-helix transcriptional regulator [Hyphomicrobiales bacterium]
MEAARQAGAQSSDDRLDQVFHALADRTRRSLLRRLAKGPARVTDLAEPFAMSLPAVSKHLRVLERAGLVDRTVAGRVHRCSFGGAPLDEVEGWLAGTRAFWQDRLESLAAYVGDQVSDEESEGK